MERMKCTSWLMKTSVPSYCWRRLDQRVDARHVEMRSRFIEKQQVGGLEEDLHEG